MVIIGLQCILHHNKLIVIFEYQLSKFDREVSLKWPKRKHLFAGSVTPISCLKFSKISTEMMDLNLNLLISKEIEPLC